MNKEKLRKLKSRLNEPMVPGAVLYPPAYYMKAVIEALLEDEDDWARSRCIPVNVFVLEVENGYKIRTAPLAGKRLEYTYDACLHPDQMHNHLKFALRGALLELPDQLAKQLEGENK